MLRIILSMCAMMLSCYAVAEEQQAGVVKVMVFKSGTTPSEALKNPQYQFRVLRGSAAPGEFLCDACRDKLLPEAAPDQDRLILVNLAENNGIAYICRRCQAMVWRDKGKELEFTKAQEIEALQAIKRELLVKMAPSQAIAKRQVEPAKKPVYTGPQ